MLDRFASLTHLLRMFVKPTLNGFENVLMLPSCDPSLLCSGTAMFDGAALTGIGPVSAYNHSILFGGVVVGEPLSGGTNINVLFSQIAKVLFAKTSFRLCIRRHRLWQRDRDTRPVALKNLLTAEVAAVRNNIEICCFQRHLGLLGHTGKLRPVAAHIGHLVGDDQMMLGVDGDLYVVAHYA